ncbi:MAG: SBBP repeat-containing protein [Bacteroidetes bacterium]|nr:SBBP repeat-containing protein [Bacteroidota bacterium]
MGIYSWGASTTNGSTEIATAGTYQPYISNTSGFIAGFLARFTTTGQRQWGTFYSGFNDDQVLGVCIYGPPGNPFSIIITGFTASNNAISSPGIQGGTFNGGTDIFVASINPANGTRQWGRYLGGSGLDDGNAVAVDGSGNIYVAGFTNSTNLAALGTTPTSPPGNGDGIIAKFTNTGNLVWSKFIGGPGYDAFNSLYVDNIQTVFACGESNSNSGLSVNNFPGNPYGSNDVLLTKLNDQGTVNWSGCYGGTGADFGCSICPSPGGDFICRITQSNSGYSGAPTYGGGRISWKNCT